MNTDALIVTAQFLHTLATIAWLGGIMANLFIVMPSAKKSLEPMQIGKFMGSVMKKFRILAYVSLFILLITGIILDTQSDPTLETDTMKLLMGIKHGMVTVLFFLTAFAFEVWAPKVGKNAAMGPSPKLKKMQKIQGMLALSAFVIILLIVFVSILH